jgi:co-chaperonin GroES (HSP10)
MKAKSNLTVVGPDKETEAVPLDTSPLPFDLAPANDWILVRVAVEGQTPGGLYLPENYQDDTPRAEVVAVGPGRQLINGGREPCGVKVGQTVMLQGNGVVIDQRRRFYLIPEKNVLAVVRGLGN